MEFIILLILLIIGHIGLYGVFKKLGIPAWKALVPVIGKIEWLKLVGHKPWRYILLLIPIVNFFILAGLMISTANSFGRHELKDHFLAVVFAPFYLCFLGFSKNERFKYAAVPLMKEWKTKINAAKKSGNKFELEKLNATNPFKKGQGREWTEAIIFAVFAATFIRMFLIEAFTIPTQSMESSLMKGDFLFVSKAHYGMRMPYSPLQLPLLHNTIPFIGKESYLKWIEWDYNRIGSTSSIKRNDAVVFNFPEGDTIAIRKNAPAGTRNYYYFYKRAGIPEKQLREGGEFDIRYRPIDRRDHYIKRCVALPGQTFELKDRQLYINGEKAENPKKIQWEYEVKSANGQPFTKDYLLGIDVDENAIDAALINNRPVYPLNQSQIDAIKQTDPKATVKLLERNSPFSATRMPQDAVFPHDPFNFPRWTWDNYGPLTVPKKGETIKLSPENISLYQRIISVYEKNKLEVNDGRFIINGEPTEEYTFKMNYYWMMGDNRHSSEDSRYWGFVPEDHVVGKPLFIWFSLKNAKMGGNAGGIRFDRVMTTAQKF